MVLFVTFVGFLIHVYSIGYMGRDPGYARFMAYLNLFMFAMLTLVLGANYAVLFVGWEGPGRSPTPAGGDRRAQHVAKERLPARRVKGARPRGRVQGEPIKRRAQWLVVGQVMRLEGREGREATHPLRPRRWHLARDGGGGEVAPGSPGTSGSLSSSSIPSRPRRPRCRSMRRTVLSSTAPTSGKASAQQAAVEVGLLAPRAGSLAPAPPARSAVRTPRSLLVALAFRALADLGLRHEPSYASRKSFLGMSACVQIVRRVDHLICGWLGSVKGVEEPSGFARRIATCALSRTSWKPSFSRARRTRACGASTGNFPMECQTLTPASATKASRIGSSTSSDSGPNVSA